MENDEQVARALEAELRRQDEEQTRLDEAFARKLQEEEDEQAKEPPKRPPVQAVRADSVLKKARHVQEEEEDDDEEGDDREQGFEFFGGKFDIGGYEDVVLREQLIKIGESVFVSKDDKASLRKNERRFDFHKNDRVSSRKLAEYQSFKRDAKAFRRKMRDVGVLDAKKTERIAELVDIMLEVDASGKERRIPGLNSVWRRWFTRLQKSRLCKPSQRIDPTTGKSQAKCSSKRNKKKRDFFLKKNLRCSSFTPFLLLVLSPHEAVRKRSSSHT